jgi:hypothetical protein
LWVFLELYSVVIQVMISTRMRAAAKEEDTEQAYEQNKSTPGHLVDTGCHKEKTHVHEGRMTTQSMDSTVTADTPSPSLKLTAASHSVD